MDNAMPEDDVQLATHLGHVYGELRQEVAKVIVGQADVVEQMLIAIFCNAHCLMVGVPGLAKTLLVSTLARAFDLSFKRIQFTPDLMPADITGTDIIQEDEKTGRRHFEFFRGPIFANVILADEINRTPPKTQAALLEAMQERHVTVGDHTYDLVQPFFVLATQNPLEQEGTYPLPEAQLDRFMFMVNVDYPSREEELEIMRRTTVKQDLDVRKMLSGTQILALQSVVRRVPVGDHVFDYAVNLVRASRPRDETAPEFIKGYLSYGAGPRACQNLILGAKARSLLKGRVYATMQDVDALARPVMRHRLGTNFNADSEGVGVEDILNRLIEHNQARKPQEG
jgi:MoxR-like ATPase